MSGYDPVFERPPRRLPAGLVEVKPFLSATQMAEKLAAAEAALSSAIARAEAAEKALAEMKVTASQSAKPR